MRERGRESSHCALDLARVERARDLGSLLVVVVDNTTGKIVQCSSDIAPEIGYAPRDLLGAALAMLVRPGQVSAALDRGTRVADSAAPCQMRAPLRCRDGTSLDVELSANALEDAQGRQALTLVKFDALKHASHDRDALRRENGELRVLAGALSIAAEKERQRLAEGLHDDLGQVLAMVKMKFGELEAMLPGGASLPLIDGICALVDDALRITRTATFDLNCSVLQKLGLVAAIDDLRSEFNDSTDPQLHFDGYAGPLPFSRDMQAILYRAIRELLFNVRRHACARNVRVRLTSSTSGLLLSVDDDGKGFVAQAEAARDAHQLGFGLISVERQIAAVGGALRIDSAPGRGTCAEICLPWTVAQQATD